MKPFCCIQQGPLARDDLRRAQGLVVSTYVLVGDDLDILHMARRLEDLAENILGHARVQTPDIQSPLVRLRRGTPSKGATAAGRHDAALVAAAHGGRDGGGDGIVVLWDVLRRRRHVRAARAAILAAVEAGSTGIRLGRWRQVGRRRRGDVLSHDGQGRVAKAVELSRLGSPTELWFRTSSIARYRSKIKNQ